MVIRREWDDGEMCENEEGVWMYYSVQNAIPMFVPRICFVHSPCQTDTRRTLYIGLVCDLMRISTPQSLTSANFTVNISLHGDF